MQSLINTTVRLSTDANVVHLRTHLTVCVQAKDGCNDANVYMATYIGSASTSDQSGVAPTPDIVYSHNMKVVRGDAAGTAFPSCRFFFGNMHVYIVVKLSNLII